MCITHPDVVCHDSVLTALEEVETGREWRDGEVLLPYVDMKRNQYLVRIY